METGVPVALRVGGPDDIEFVMALERVPGNEELTARWSRTEHLAALALPDTRYLLGAVPGGDAEGFAILERILDPHEGAKLKRIAVARPGTGFGQPFLAAITRWVFEQTAAERLWLDVFTYNERARHVYRKAGFREDGLLRQAYVLPSGARVDRVIMSVLRREWARP
jgi:GNAT superfamily N-acetyltransferase